MAHFQGGVMHEHDEDCPACDGDPWRSTREKLSAESAAAHARIDEAIRPGYRSALDRGYLGPAPLAPQGWVETPPTLEGIRERLATGAGDRNQLFRDITFLLAALAEPKP